MTKDTLKEKLYIEYTEIFLLFQIKYTDKHKQISLIYDFP